MIYLDVVPRRLNIVNISTDFYDGRSPRPSRDPPIGSEDAIRVRIIII